jgi:hypothetical protein
MKVLLKPPQWKVFGCQERFRGKCCNFDGVLEIGPMTTPTSRS